MALKRDRSRVVAGKTRMATCHSDKKHQAKGLCSTCYYKSRNPPHPKSLMIASCHPDKKHYADNMCEGCYRNKYKYKWNRENPERIKRYNQSRNFRPYGLSREQYDKMFQDQNGLCAICLKPETAVRLGKIQILSLDHNHTTGKVRKLLCVGCNTALGLVQENSTILLAMLEYIRQEA